MKKIIVAYWHSKIEGIKFNHKEEFEYSKKRRNKIIDYLLENGLSVMLRGSTDQLIIWIDKYRFGQR